MSQGIGSRPLEILLVEDNAGDVRLTREVLKDAGTQNRLSVAVDGEEAMEFLLRVGKYQHAPRPDLVLLDLNLPRKDGREVLLELKSMASLRSIPVVVFTTSSAKMDIQKCYDLHANCYIIKPIDLDGFIRVVRWIEEFWFNIVRLPSS